MAAKSCMSGRSIELNDRGDQVVIRFPYDTSIVSELRRLSKRRFDQIAKCWCCPVDIVVEVVDALSPHDFSVSPSALDLYRARGGTKSTVVVSEDSAGLPAPKCAAAPPVGESTSRTTRIGS